MVSYFGQKVGAKLKMIIYTYQPQSLIDNIYANDFAFVIYEETNLFKQSNGKVNQYQNAYMWMARKLGEKTGIWMKDLYGNNINLPKDADGDYVDEEGQKLPVLPFWGWYLTDGKNQKPDPEMYCFDSRVISSIPQWSKSDSRTMLLTLDVPVSNTGNSEATDRKVVVKDSEGNSQEEVGGVPSLSPAVLTFKNVAAGTTQIYVTGNALRFYKIEFHSN